MNSNRSLLSLTICFCILVSVFPLAETSASTSLWGKKVKFRGIPCLWQLQPETRIPALPELTACVLLRRTTSTKWTGFVYKSPRNNWIELGLGGSAGDLEVWLFGEKWNVQINSTLNEWNSVCVTWSGQGRRLRIYINGTSLKEIPLNPILPQELSENGTLSLGVSHFINGAGKVQQESGTNLIGEIGLFRIWAREWSAEELRMRGCADGDVLSWDLRHWQYDCDPEPDNNRRCEWALYKIKMWTFVVHSTNSGNCSMSLEDITRNWLQSVFPQNISVQDIVLSSPSRTCHVVNNSVAQHAQQPQGFGALPEPTCHKCFSCEVIVNVDPPANVEVVQVDIAALLSLTFSNNFLNLSVDPKSISILPVELSAVTEHPPTVSSSVTPSETGSTQTRPARPTNMSTTGEPLDFNETAVGADKFFRVNLNSSISDSPIKPEDVIEKWVKEQLEVRHTIIVLNVIIKEHVGSNMEQHTGLMTSHDQQKRYYSAFHVQDYSINTVAEIKTFIDAALTSDYKNGSIIIQTMGVEIKHIMPENCLEETMSTIYGQYIWAETFPQVIEEMGCRKPQSKRATRLCNLDIETDTTSWAEPNMTNCAQLVEISDLDNITVTTGNAAEVVDVIQDLVEAQLVNSEELSASQLDSVVEKLSKVVDISVIEPAVGANIVNIVANILLSKSDVTPVANIVLNLTDRMGHNMDFEEESMSLTAPSLALSIINVEQGEFSGLTFGVSSVLSTMNPTVFLNQSFGSGPIPETNASISLPYTLHEFFPVGVRNTTRIQFQFYGTHELFQDPLSTNETQSSWKINSYIVSASINNSHVINLKDRVVVTLSHQNPTKADDKVQCMFWDFQKNDGQGGWNDSGCETQSISSYQTSCLCDHLTHFAVLLDISRAPISEVDSHILTVISYLGCGISSIFLGITLLTYLAFEKLRQDYPSKILINLSAALLGLGMLFLLDSWLSSFSNYGLCIATAATLHYFLLASFTWMGLEAVHMYLSLVKVFNTYIPSYILKLCAVGWGIPLLIVSLVLAIDKDAYGSAVPEDTAVVLQSTDQFCWLQNDVFFYVTGVAFVLLIVLCNMSVFILVLIQIRRMRANKPSANSRNTLHDLRAVASLTVLLGLTWSMGFFSIGPGRVALMYLFTICNSLQGLLIFVFHCLMKDNVRKQWRIYLCCGRFRLSDYSDWSHSATVGGLCKKNNLVNSVSVNSDNTSSMTSLQNKH